MENVIKITDKIIDKVNEIIKLALDYEESTGRRLGVTGEIGEVLVCQKLGLSLIANRNNAGYDALDESGKIKYQIKTRRTGGTRVGRFSSHDFDYFIFAILDKNYNLNRLYKISFDEIKLLIEENPKRNPSVTRVVSLATEIKL
jgi:hypothetical protein